MRRMDLLKKIDFFNPRYGPLPLIKSTRAEILRSGSDLEYNAAHDLDLVWGLGLINNWIIY